MGEIQTNQFRAVINFIDSLKDRKGIPGCSVQIMQHGKCVLEHYTGMAHVEKQRKVQENTLFRAFSMTKLITCTCAMQLYEQGCFDLNEPLFLYLPEYEHMKVYTKMESDCDSVTEAKNPILIKDLFRMSAGLTYEGTLLPTERKVGELLSQIYQNFETELITTRELAQKLAQIPLAYEPGTHWRYSMAHDVLGALIEVVSGMRLQDYMKRFLFEPLEMKDTAFHWENGELENRLAGLYSMESGHLESAYVFEGNYTNRSLYESGGAGLITTLGDYMKFANAMALGGTNQDGVRLIGRKTLDLMRMNHLNEEMMKDYNWDHQAAYGYGLGCRTMIHPQKGGCNSSYGEFGWSGLAGTLVFMDPAEELAVVYMQQMKPSMENYVMPRLRSVVYGCL